MKKILLLVFLASTTVGFAQKIKNQKGNFKFLKGETEVEVQFDYSDLKLLKENLTEEEYIANRKKDLNDKEAGNGDVWEKKWRSSKEAIWQPKFIELLLKTATKKTGIRFKEESPESRYLMKVEVVWIYPGWDVFMMKQAAKVTTKITLVEKNNPDTILVYLDAIEAPGDQYGSNFSNESRVGEGFAKTAKTIGSMIAKQAK